MKTMMDDQSDRTPGREADCSYKGEQYIARDDGSVWRHPREGKPPRPNENQWIFGKPNAKGHLEIASVPVHRIVATAFHGDPPAPEYLVYHIDTIKQNNRPENLRWVTRLESALLNPATAKHIAITCGSVEAFLTDPLKFRDRFEDISYQWLGTVSHQDAQLCYERLLAWAKSDPSRPAEALDDWLVSQTGVQRSYVPTTPVLTDVAAMTKNAIQREWIIPSEFPYCPQEYTGEPIKAYSEKLIAGAVFCRNDLYSALVSKSGISDDYQTLYVLSESPEGADAIKPWALAKITYEDGVFVHHGIGQYFTQEGAEKQYCLIQGLEWAGGDSVDDYC